MRHPPIEPGAIIRIGPHKDDGRAVLLAVLLKFWAKTPFGSVAVIQDDQKRNDLASLARLPALRQRFRP